MKVLYVLSSTEDVASEIAKFDGVEQLMLCVKSKQTGQEISRIAIKVLYNIYSSEVPP